MIKKKFLKTKCQVTFELPKGATQGADSVQLVGDFNDWDEKATPMEKKRGNRFVVTLDLKLNHEYQYRYLVNRKDWHNDWEADKYVSNPFSGDNSVVSTYLSETPETF
ncbi:MAG TPA: isoamylase early set domain-containing protein [Aggregatilineales bacterium]|nr:isoamylase early set domain-containing protein [Aggregatilineales bacterium]